MYYSFAIQLPLIRFTAPISDHKFNNIGEKRDLATASPARMIGSSDGKSRHFKDCPASIRGNYCTLSPFADGKK
jgi:hypothetical protein